MRVQRRILVISLSAIVAASSRALEVGPEKAVVPAIAPASQRSVVVSSDSSRTLMAFEETLSEGQLSRVILHQYEARLGVVAGRETHPMAPSAHHQRRPVLGGNLVAWVEEEPNGPGASLWWQYLSGHTVGASFRPEGSPERVADVARGTRLDVFNTHVFHVMLWTAPDGRLKAVYRSLIARIGYDPSPFYVTDEPALNPATAENRANEAELIAYNRPLPGPVCEEGGCTPRYAISATVFGGRSPHPAIDIAPAGASEPRVVFNGKDYVVFWSMEDGGTYAQRVSTAGGRAARIGEPLRIHDGVLHDAARGRNDEYLLAVQRGLRFSFVRFDSNLERIEASVFAANPADGERVSLAGNEQTQAMLAYGAERSAQRPEAVYRVIGDDLAARRRRSVR